MPGSGGRSLRNVWPVLFFLGLVMLNRPFINIFDNQTQLLGIPTLFHYLMIGWAVSIGVIVIYRLAVDSKSDKSGG